MDLGIGDMLVRHKHDPFSKRMAMRETWKKGKVRDGWMDGLSFERVKGGKEHVCRKKERDAVNKHLSHTFGLHHWHVRPQMTKRCWKVCPKC